MAELEIIIPRPQRWDEPFGIEMTDADVDSLLRDEPFRAIDPTAFPPSLPLRGILRNDTRINRYQSGALIVREGDYGNSAFLVLAGRVRVVVDRLDSAWLGRGTPPSRNWLAAVGQLWRNSRSPEVRKYGEKCKNGVSGDGLSTREEEGQTRVFIQDVPRLLESTGSIEIGPGEIFGELAALSRMPRTATVLAESSATLLEIRWQGLRDLMKRTPAIRQHVERLYRENSLLVHLRQTPLLRDLPPAAMEPVLAETTFESYGNFDWYTDFHSHRDREPAERIAAEPLIASQGDPVDGLLLIRSGFARVSQLRGHGHHTFAYLGKGQTFGLPELLEAATTHQPVALRSSLRAVGYVDVIRIPTKVVIDAVLPHCNGTSAPNYVQSEIRNPKSEIDSSTSLNPRTLDFLADHRIFNGTQTMLINLDRCTRCDDCVRACAATHDNNPRFVRQGTKHDNLMIADACMHCVDPVCMIGCPTGAIARDESTGIVRINDPTCIGCATCANSCPYNAIGMVEIRDVNGAFLLDQVTQQPILKATKCDLCASQLTGPACQHACPHDALVRADMTEVGNIARWLGRP